MVKHILLTTEAKHYFFPQFTHSHIIKRVQWLDIFCLRKEAKQYLFPNLRIDAVKSFNDQA